ncbi:hypothetical protein [Thermogemmatispora onikobensis]|uniref:hypothetical protein n=1 Tax=Thermogemmatispora onikobensis TaxID=732234 RepID=UPI000852A70C|nr:hypothetical protein [Thermogemmatispora onikobensis]
MEQLSHEQASEKIVALERRLKKEQQSRTRRSGDACLRPSFSLVTSLGAADISVPTGSKNARPLPPRPSKS